MSTPVRLGAGFWRVWSASTVSELGSGLTYVALPLLTVTLTRDARLVSLVGAAQALPFLLFGLQSGAVADRLDRRRIMWATDVLRAALTALLVLLVITGPLTVGVLCGLAFALGAADILFLNASTAIIPDLVAPEGLERANAWLGSAQVVASSFVGLPLAPLSSGCLRLHRSRSTRARSPLLPPSCSGCGAASGPCAQGRRPCGRTFAKAWSGCGGTSSCAPWRCCWQ